MANNDPTPLERASLARDQITVGVADAVNTGMLASIKIVAERVPGWQPWAKLIE